MGKIDWSKSKHAFVPDTWLKDVLMYVPIQGDTLVEVKTHTATAFAFDDIFYVAQANWTGTGFSYDSHFALKGGTIKSATTKYQHETVSFSGLSVNVAAYNAAKDSTGAMADVAAKALKGNDTFVGSKYGDLIQTLKGNDNINGGAGKDTIDGGVGKDTIDGGKGADTLTGGAGADHFKFAGTTNLASADRVEDFVHGIDKFDLVKSGFKALGASVTSNEFVQREDNVAQTNKQHLIYDTENHRLWYDADGAGDKPPVLIALTYTSVLTFDDFRMI